MVVFNQAFLLFDHYYILTAVCIWNSNRVIIAVAVAVAVISLLLLKIPKAIDDVEAGSFNGDRQPQVG